MRFYSRLQIQESRIGWIALLKWGDRNARLGHWATLLRNDTEGPHELTRYPCRTCFKLSRFIPAELQTPNLHPVGKGYEANGEHAHQDSLRKLYRFFFYIANLPVLSPPDGCGRSYATSPCNPRDDRRGRAPTQDLPLLERPTQKLVRWLADEEQYRPSEGEMEVGENLYGGDFNGRDIGFFASSKNIAKRRRGGSESEGIDQPVCKKNCATDEGMRRQRPHQRQTVVGAYQSMAEETEGDP